MVRPIILFVLLISLLHVSMSLATQSKGNPPLSCAQLGIVQRDVGNKKIWKYSDLMILENGKETLMGEKPSSACKISLIANANVSITFDGKVIHKVNAQAQKSLKSGFTIGNNVLPLMPFYPEFFQENPAHRPFITTTSNSFADPAQWKPAAPSEAAKQAARILFRNQVRVQAAKLPFVNYDLAYVQFFKAYMNRDGDQLIGLLFDRKKAHKDHPENFEGEYFEIGEDEYPQWFFFPKEGLPTKLTPKSLLTEENPQNSNDALFPIDAGDYDGDGTSEFMFGVVSTNKYRQSDFFQNYVLYPFDEMSKAARLEKNQFVSSCHGKWGAKWIFNLPDSTQGSCEKSCASMIDVHPERVFACFWNDIPLSNRISDPDREICSKWTWDRKTGVYTFAGLAPDKTKKERCSQSCELKADKKSPTHCVFAGEVVAPRTRSCILRFTQNKFIFLRNWNGNAIDRNNCKGWCGEGRTEFPEATAECLYDQKVVTTVPAPRAEESSVGDCEIIRTEQAKVVHTMKDRSSKKICQAYCDEWIETADYWGAQCAWRSEVFRSHKAVIHSEAD